jgi:hypothetical protein
MKKKPQSQQGTYLRVHFLCAVTQAPAPQGANEPSPGAEALGKVSSNECEPRRWRHAFLCCNITAPEGVTHVPQLRAKPHPSRFQHQES